MIKTDIWLIQANTGYAMMAVPNDATGYAMSTVLAVQAAQLGSWSMFIIFINITNMPVMDPFACQNSSNITEHAS